MKTCRRTHLIPICTLNEAENYRSPTYVHDQMCSLACNQIRLINNINSKLVLYVSESLLVLPSSFDSVLQVYYSEVGVDIGIVHVHVYKPNII